MSQATTNRDRSRDRGVARLWLVVTGLLALAVFSQAIFAGVLLSAASWGRIVHRSLAFALVLATVGAALIAAGTLRHRPPGRRLAGTLLALGLVLVIQTGLGIRSAEAGATTMWIHVPLGVAVVGLSLRPTRLARQLAHPPMTGTVEVTE